MTKESIKYIFKLRGKTLIPIRYKGKGYELSCIKKCNQSTKRKSCSV